MLQADKKTKTIPTSSLFHHSLYTADRDWFFLLVGWFVSIIAILFIGYRLYTSFQKDLTDSSVSLRDVARVEGWEPLEAIVQYTNEHPEKEQSIIQSEKTYVDPLVILQTTSTNESASMSTSISY